MYMFAELGQVTGHENSKYQIKYYHFFATEKKQHVQCTYRVQSQSALERIEPLIESEA